MLSVRCAGILGLLVSIALVSCIVLVVVLAMFSRNVEEIRDLYTDFADDSLVFIKDHLSARIESNIERLLTLTSDESYRFFTAGIEDSVKALMDGRALLENEGYNLREAEGVTDAAHFVIPHLFKIISEYGIMAIAVGAPAVPAIGGSSVLLGRVGAFARIMNAFAPLFNLSRLDPAVAGYDTSYPLDFAEQPKQALFFNETYIAYVFSTVHHLLDAQPKSFGEPSHHPAKILRTLPRSALSVTIMWQDNMSVVENTSCAFASTASYLYRDGGGECYGQASDEEVQAQLDECLGAPHLRACHPYITMPYQSATMQRFAYGPVLMLRTGIPVVNLSLTNPIHAYDRLVNHNKGLGLAEVRANGNVMANCSVTEPCSTTDWVENGAETMATPIYDDHVGSLSGFIPLDHRAVVLKALAERRTLAMRREMSSAARARGTVLGLDDEYLRVFVVDATGFLLATSTGASPLVANGVIPLYRSRMLDGFTVDPVAVAVCQAIRTSLGKETVEADGEGLCGLARVLPRRARAADSDPPARRLTAVIDSVRWRVEINLRDMPLAECLTLSETCVEGVWVIVAVPEWDLVHSAQLAVDALVAQQEADVAAADAAVNEAFQLTLGIVLASAFLVVLLASVVGACLFSIVMRPVGRVAMLVWTASTLDVGSLHKALKVMSANLPASISKAEQAAEDGAAHDVEVTQDIRAELLIAASDAVKPSRLTAAELAELGGSVRALVRALVSLMKYVPEEVALMYASSGQAAKLKMSAVDAVVLVSDVADFTSWCERTPLAVVLSVMSGYFSSMCDCVHVTGGSIDKFVGDAVIGTWGALTQHEHPGVAAVATALNMLGVVERRGNKWSGLKSRVGIHSGGGMMGNMGSVHRYQHTLIGGCMDGAERMEEACSPVGVTLLVSESVLNREPDVNVLFPMRPVARVSVEGVQEWGYDVHFASNLLTRALKAGQVKAVQIDNRVGGSRSRYSGSVGGLGLTSAGTPAATIPTLFSQELPRLSSSTRQSSLGPRGSAAFPGFRTSGSRRGSLFGMRGTSSAGGTALGSTGPSVQTFGKHRAQLFNLAGVYAHPPIQLLTDKEVAAFEAVSTAIQAGSMGDFAEVTKQLQVLRPIRAGGTLPLPALHALRGLERMMTGPSSPGASSSAHDTSSTCVSAFDASLDAPPVVKGSGQSSGLILRTARDSARGSGVVDLTNRTQGSSSDIARRLGGGGGGTSNSFRGGVGGSGGSGGQHGSEGMREGGGGAAGEADQGGSGRGGPRGPALEGSVSLASGSGSGLGSGLRKEVGSESAKNALSSPTTASGDGSRDRVSGGAERLVGRSPAAIPSPAADLDEVVGPSAKIAARSHEPLKLPEPSPSSAAASGALEVTAVSPCDPEEARAGSFATAQPPAAAPAAPSRGVHTSRPPSPPPGPLPPVSASLLSMSQKSGGEPPRGLRWGGGQGTRVSSDASVAEPARGVRGAPSAHTSGAKWSQGRAVGGGVVGRAHGDV